MKLMGLASSIVPTANAMTVGDNHGLELAGSLLKRLRPELAVSKQKLRQADGRCRVRLKREEGKQNLGLSSRPFVLCGYYKRLPPSGLPLGDLRNLAVGEATGEFIAQWDDDDLSHPQRLEIQMAALEVMGADAAFLQRELIWWPREERLAVSRSRVWESTILCRKCQLPAYPSLVRAEDTPVVSTMMNELRLALVDAPNLYMYVWHGSNTFEESHFDRQWELADKRYQGRGYRGMRDALSARFPLDGYAEALGAPLMPRRDAISVEDMLPR